MDKLNGEILGDGVEGAPAVIHPPPGLGLLNFRSLKSNYIHQFEVWCVNAEAAKFIGMLILNKGRHNRIMKMHYVAHPIMNGIVILMVETDDEFYFGAHFIEGCGQMQMLNPAVKYMENVIGTDATQEWRTKCWNAIDAIKYTEYSNPMIDNVAARHLCEQMPGFGKFGNLLRMDKGTVFGSVSCGETTGKDETKEQISIFIRSMNFLLAADDFTDGPPPLEGDEPLAAAEQREEGKMEELMNIHNDETFFFDDNVSCDEVFLLPDPDSSSTPKKKAKKDESHERLQVFNFDQNQRSLIKDDDDDEQEEDDERKVSAVKLIAEIQDHYKSNPTTGELASHLKEVGDDFQAMKDDALNKRAELWGFFQKTEGDLKDYLKETGELPEHLMKNDFFYEQWKGKKMIDIIFNHYDNDQRNSGEMSGKFTDSFILKEYGEYLIAKEKMR